MNSVEQGPGVASDQNTEENPINLAGNTKLWLGKDYSNFIFKDWTLLDRPFEGTLNLFHQKMFTHQRWIAKFLWCKKQAP